MGSTKTTVFALAVVVGLAGFASIVPARAGGRRAQSAQQGQSIAATPGAVVRLIGAVATIKGNHITIKTDSGPEAAIEVEDATRLLRIQPGQKSLKNATPLQLNDLQVGDRILVMGKGSSDGKSVLATSVIAIKQSDLAQEHQREEEEWQKNGVGGLVKAVDPAADTITIATNTAGKTVTIHTSKTTILRRYAPGSVRFQDAKPGTFDQIKPGDQLRARGVLSAGGTEVAAAEVVSGSFENIAGTITSVDSGAGEITVMDLVSKKPVLVKITAESELRELPELTAQKIAARLKAHKAGPAAGASGSQSAAADETQQQGVQAGGPDLDQILKGLPQVSVGDLHKGNAVMVVSTEDPASTTVTAIKLVSGVAPILRVSPAKSQGKALQSLWSGFGGTGGGGGGGGETQTPAPR
ncbi:MAG: hypothetical protein ACRD11_04325 [Terriglobia bacterium]